MTKEQAIDIIKCLAWHARPDEEQIEQAIKALEQQPSDDCVSRQQALLQLTGVNLSDKTTEELIGLFCRRINELPPVIPTHGTCKDCSHYDPLTCNSGTCLNPNMQWSDEVSATHYCADFEKRGDEKW